MFEEIKKLKTDKKTLREFAFLVGGIFGLIGLFSWWKGGAWYGIFLGLSGALMLPGAVFPAVLRPVYLGWMMLALALGWVMTRVILSLFFYGVLTPIALFMRVFHKKEILDLSYPGSAQSYWVKKAVRRDKTSYEKQY